MRFLVYLMLCLCFSLAQSNPISLVLERYLVSEQVQDGKSVEVLIDTIELQPGDIIEETLIASNVSDDSLGNISLELPVPNGTYYLAKSADTLVVAEEEIQPQFSFDSGNSFAYPPLMKEITVVEDGKEVIKTVEVKSEEYTHVRWLIPGLIVDEQISASFRARVR